MQWSPYTYEAACELKMAVAGVHFGNTNCSIAVCKVAILSVIRIFELEKHANKMC